MPDITRLHVLVHGRVQGVGYRYTCGELARASGLGGWVRNLPDGRVEVLMEGEESAVHALREWLHQGPEKAQVTDVALQDMPAQGITGFIVRR